jgi:hypothetical protein
MQHVARFYTTIDAILIEPTQMNRRGLTSPQSWPRKRGRKEGKANQPNKKKRKKMSEVEKGEMRLCFKLDLSNTNTARLVGCHLSTVSRWRNRFNLTGEMKRKAGSGRNPITTRIQDRHLRIMSMRDRRATSVSLAKDLNHPDAAKQISSRTIRRRLQSFGLNGRIARRKPLLTAKNIQQRIRWAKKYRDWTVDQWKKVLWSDESPFTIFPSPSKQYVRRRPGEELRRGCIVPTVKHGGGKVMVWGSFTANGVGPIIRINGKMDQHVYHSTLVKQVVPTMKRLQQAELEEKKEERKEEKQRNKEKNGQLWVFQHDNDPKHTAKKNKHYLEMKQSDPTHPFAILEWPSQSPDMNPIEHLWQYVKRRLRSESKRAKSQDELFDRIVREWKMIPKSYLLKLTETMPERIANLIKNRGRATRY